MTSNAQSNQNSEPTNQGASPEPNANAEVGNYTHNNPAEERRRGPLNRRQASYDRRDEERVLSDLLPRRNPDVMDRRTLQNQ